MSRDTVDPVVQYVVSSEVLATNKESLTSSELIGGEITRKL